MCVGVFLLLTFTIRKHDIFSRFPWLNLLKFKLHKIHQQSLKTLNWLLKIMTLFITLLLTSPPEIPISAWILPQQMLANACCKAIIKGRPKNRSCVADKHRRATPSFVHCCSRNKDKSTILYSPFTAQRLNSSLCDAYSKKGKVDTVVQVYFFLLHNHLRSDCSVRS